jgi:hypothetical protein
MSSTKQISDFHLIPISKEGKSGWEYRVATWPIDQVDPKVHLLFDDKSIDPVKYQRKTFRDDTLQNCIILKENGRIVMKPGNNYHYYVKKVSENNKTLDNLDTDDDTIPHNMVCDVCMSNKKTHLLIECGHCCMCGICAIQVYNDTKKCPICTEDILSQPIKIIFT